MRALCPRPDEHAAIRTDLKAIFVSLELSRSTWVITSLAPGGGEKMSKHSVRNGDIAGVCRTRWIQNPSSPASWMTHHWTRGGRHALVGRLVPHVQQPKAGCRLCRAGPHAMAKRIGPPGPGRLQGRQSPAANDHDPDRLAVAAASAAVSAGRV